MIIDVVRKLCFSQERLYPIIRSLRYLDCASSCNRRRGSGSPLRDTGGHVHRVPDAQEGRGLVRPGRAEKIARGASLPQAGRASPQSGVLRLRRRRRDGDFADSSRDLTMPSRVKDPPTINARFLELRWSMVKQLLRQTTWHRAHRLSQKTQTFYPEERRSERRPILDYTDPALDWLLPISPLFLALNRPL